MTDKSDIDLNDLVGFLCGEYSLDGYWFDDLTHSKGKYWWRKLLREAVAAQDRSSRISELESLTRIYTGLVSAAVIRDLADRIEHLKHQADSEKEKHE